MSCVLLWLTEPALPDGRAPLCFALSGGARVGCQPGGLLTPPDRFHTIPEAQAAGRRSRRGGDGRARPLCDGWPPRRSPPLRHSAGTAALSAFSYFLCAKSVSDHLALAASGQPRNRHLVIQEGAVGVPAADCVRARSARVVASLL